MMDFKTVFSNIKNKGIEICITKEIAENVFVPVEISDCKDNDIVSDFFLLTTGKFDSANPGTKFYSITIKENA